MYMDDQLALIQKEMDKFPPTFRVRAFPHLKLRLNLKSSYLVPDEDGGDNHRIMLYTQVKREDDNVWLDFAKTTATQLRMEILLD